MAKMTHLYDKRDLLTWQNRPTYVSKGPKNVAKETYWYGLAQKRPIYVAKETY